MADCPLVTAPSLDALAAAARPLALAPSHDGGVNALALAPRWRLPARPSAFRTAPRTVARARAAGIEPASWTTRASRSTSTGPEDYAAELSRLLASARAWSRAPRHLLAEGLHPADEALPGRLPLLHLRAPAAPGERAYMSADEVLAVARAGAARGLPRGALHARRQARAALPRRARGARGARLRDDDRVPRADVRARARGDRPAPPRQPGRDVARGARAPPARVTASQGLMLETTSTRLSAEGGPHYGSPDKLPGAAPGDDPPRRRARRPLHDRDPDRDRRDARGAARGPCGDRGAARALRPRPGGDRPELPRQAGDEDGRPSGAQPRRAPLDGAGGAGGPAGGRPRAGAAQPLLRRLSRACSRPGSTTGAASRR